MCLYTALNRRQMRMYRRRTSLLLMRIAARHRSGTVSALKQRRTHAHVSALSRCSIARFHALASIASFCASHACSFRSPSATSASFDLSVLLMKVRSPCSLAISIASATDSAWSLPFRASRIAAACARSRSVSTSAAPSRSSTFCKYSADWSSAVNFHCASFSSRLSRFRSSSSMAADSASLARDRRWPNSSAACDGVKTACRRLSSVP
mmetsp:Transcript_41359/g.90803  ORF Transcript_41359/g.90803 Transcript_41359/m.90803 type:complete len:209 (+) Transcript_41359:228-854(+)